MSTAGCSTFLRAARTLIATFTPSSVQVCHILNVFDRLKSHRNGPMVSHCSLRFSRVLSEPPGLLWPGLLHLLWLHPSGSLLSISLASLTFLGQARHTLVSGTLYLLFLQPRTFFSQVMAWLTPPPPSSLYLDVTFSDVTFYNPILSNPLSSYHFCFIFLHVMYHLPSHEIFLLISFIICVPWLQC